MIVRCADAENRVNKKKHARAPAPTCRPTRPPPKVVEKAAGFGLPHDKICQLIVSERTGKPSGSTSAGDKDSGKKSTAKELEAAVGSGEE